MAGIVDDQEVVAPRMLDKGRHLYAQFDARVGDGRNGPFFGMVIVSLPENLVQFEKFALHSFILLPSQQQDRDILVAGASLHFSVDIHGSILQMPSEGLEFMAFGGWGWALGVLLARLSARLCQQLVYREVMRVGVFGELGEERAPLTCSGEYCVC